MSYEKDVRKRVRRYQFAFSELQYVGMTLWEFCQAIMQFPQEARIYAIRQEWNTDAIEIMVGSLEFAELEEGTELPRYFYDRSLRTFVECK